MRKKHIKTFSVDENIYSELVEIFKKSEPEVSLSYFVDKCLKDLHRYLKHIEEERGKSDQYTVPMSFIIEEVVKAPIISLNDEIPLPGMSEYVLTEIDEWNAEYEARKMHIPRIFYRMVKSGKFELSPDRKYVTNIKTKVKYTLDQFGEIVDIKDEEVQKRKRSGSR